MDLLNKIKMSKVIVIDSGVVNHKAIHAYVNQLRAKEEGRLPESAFISPTHYNYLNILYSALKKLDYNKEDIVIIARDGRSSWRKAFLPEYKGQRKDLRKKQEAYIDWGLEYKKIEELEWQLQEASPFHVIDFNYYFNFADLVLSKEGQKLNIERFDIDYDKKFSIESDDIQAVCCKYFPDKEVVLYTIDQDLYQLLHYKNVKIFDPNKYGVKKFKEELVKSKIKGYYVFEDNPLEILSEKIRKGDASDNIKVDKKNDTPLAVDTREIIINLVKLPEFIESPVIEKLDLIKPKGFIDDLMPFPNSLGNPKKYNLIYEKKDVVDFEKSHKMHYSRIEYQKQKRLERNAKAREKNKLKKEKQMR